MDNLNFEEIERIEFSEVKGKNMSLTMHPIIKLIKGTIVISGIRQLTFKVLLAIHIIIQKIM